MLNSEDVFECGRACIFTDEELTPELTRQLTAAANEQGPLPDCAVIARSPMVTMVFHKGRVEANRARIIGFLRELPPQFMETQGGGWSFLNACMDREDRQWTGLHSVVQTLFCLGGTLGLVVCLMPRELWSALPGGMPYFRILDSKFE
jgi:hypothetical protein